MHARREMSPNMDEVVTPQDEVEDAVIVEGSRPLVVNAKLPRSVAFSRCPTVHEALARMDAADPLLLRRMEEARLTATL